MAGPLKILKAGKALIKVFRGESDPSKWSIKNTWSIF
jgi:hypothetical protein